MMISACGVSSWAMAHSASSVIHTVHISVPYNSFLAPSITPFMAACMLIYIIVILQAASTTLDSHDGSIR